MAKRSKALSTKAPDFPHRVVANAYGFYCVPVAYEKRLVPKLLEEGKIYEADTLAFIRRLAARGGDVITGGAFVGDFLPALAEVMTKGAQIHSFEPNPLTHEAACFTIHLNGLSHLKVHPVAVGAEAARLKLQTEDAQGDALAAAARVVGADATGKTVEVDVVPLDDLVEPSRMVSVLHLDVEDHEIAALSGAERIIEVHAPCLILEANKPWKRRAILKHLNEYHPDHGYTLSGKIDGNAVYLAMERN